MTYPAFGEVVSEPDDFPTTDIVDFSVPANEPADDDTDENEETAAEPGDSSSKKASRRKAPARAARLTAAQVRRVLAQEVLVSEQDDNVRAVLAAVLGTPANTTEIVVATLTATKAPAEAIAEVENLAAITNPYEKVVAAIGIAADRENARRVWGLLTELGKVTGAIPAKEVQAGSKIAEAVDALDVGDLAALSAVTELLGG